MFQLRSVSAHPSPLMTPDHYKSYSVLAPPRTHWRPATCEEYECDGWVYGFVTTVNLATPLGQKQYDFLSHDKSRSYSMQRISMELIKFIYGPGNICMNWDQHRIPVGRPPRLLVASGDWRGNPTGKVVRHTKIEHWVEDFGENQQKLAEQQERG